MKFPKLLSTNQVTTLGSRLAAWSALSLFALLGAFLLLLPALSREVTILMALFVVVGSGVVIALGHKVNSAVRQRFEPLAQALRRMAGGDLDARAPDGTDELGMAGQTVNKLAALLKESRRLISEEGRRLHSTAKESANTSQLKSLFLANLSQELQITFNHVIGLCQMLADTKLGEEQQCITSHIEKACTKLVETLDKLSDFETLGAGHVSIVEEEFKLHTAITATVANQACKADKKGLRLRCNIHRLVPDLCIGDDKRLRQMLLNFLDNAINCTEDGEITVSAGLDEEAPTHVIVRIDVSDTSTGMSSEHASGIFQSPYADRVSEDRELIGDGLGLAICRDLAEMMGGRVGVHSKKGQGSTFWFTVRLGRCIMANAAPTLPAQDATTSSLPILLVTSSADNATEIFVALQKAGLRVNIALSRVQFLEAIKSEPYGVAVVDGERPELIATVATWTRMDDVVQVPVVGLPYQTNSDGTKDVDLDKLLVALGPWMSPDAASVSDS
ncbi:MAG: sensor histidine kinase [Planctomycetota bacterium]